MRRGIEPPSVQLSNIEHQSLIEDAKIDKNVIYLMAVGGGLESI